MSNHLISVIIPVYNAEKYLSDCIHSVLEQTYPNFEVICIDDGSTDHSVQILKRFNSSKIKIFTQANQGVSVARNFGLDQARGDLITFVDSDDVIDPHFLEKLVSIYDSSHSSVIGCRYKIFEKESKCHFKIIEC